MKLLITAHSAQICTNKKYPKAKDHHDININSFTF